MKNITVLIPTYNRVTALAATLTSLCFQNFQNFDVLISDQSEKPTTANSEVITAITRIMNHKGQHVTIMRNTPRKGMAQQRQFLLDQSGTQYSLFLDDDVILEPFVIGMAMKAIKQEGCGLVGQAVIGLSYANDKRPEQQNIEFWKGPVEPETISPDTEAWERHKLHNAANLLHLAEKHGANEANFLKYKIAWSGGCVLYDTSKLRAVGGFNFWKKLPLHHVGEDVLAQIRVLEKYGGCGLLPSGAYHQELPTSHTNRKVDAPKLLL